MRESLTFIRLIIAIIAVVAAVRVKVIIYVKDS